MVRGFLLKRHLVSSHTLTFSPAVTNLDDLAERGRQARQMIIHAGLPPDISQTIEESYRKLCNNSQCETGETCNVSVAVRSSATAEDLPTASFAGQQASFLNVVGSHSVADTVLECLASVFTGTLFVKELQCS